VLDHNVSCTVSSLDEARRNGDLDRWAAWTGGSRDDYLADDA